MIRLRFTTAVHAAALSLVVGVAQLHAATITVPPGAGLQAALNGAAPGDVIVLSAGTYTNQSGFGFRVNRAITLQGGGSTTVLLVAANANADQAGLYLMSGASGAVVTNLAVQVDTGSNAGIQIDTAASNVSLSNLSVTGGANGVVALGASATLTNLAINPNPNPANAGHGLIIRGSLVTVDTVTIGTVTKAGSNGIEVSGNSNTVRNCTVTSHPRGVFIAVGSNNVLQNCTITAQAGEGVLLAGASDNVIENNTIVRAATNGILLYPSTRPPPATAAIAIWSWATRSCERTRSTASLSNRAIRMSSSPTP